MKIKEIQHKISEENLDAFFFTSSANIFYLTNFKSSYGFVILTPSHKIFITDNRYYLEARKKLKTWQIILIDNTKKQIEQLAEIMYEYGGKKIGFEEDKITLSFYKNLKNKTNAKLVGYNGFLNDFRKTKTNEEIFILSEAISKTDKIFKKILNEIPKSTSELDIRRRIINNIFLEDGEGESFPSIVAIGKNSAVPHHETYKEPIRKNNIILIDMGIKFKGYCSDFTRVIAYGKVDEELTKIFKIVKEAHQTALDIIKPKIPAKEIDKAARKVIEKYGYGKYFTHSTGHGIGVEIHEAPRISQFSDEIIEENMVFTIEPGIYIPGKGGIRLESVVVARKNEVEILTKTPLEFFRI